MLLLTDATVVLFLRDEERFGEANCIRCWMEGIASSAPALGGQQGVSVHCCGGLRNEEMAVLGEKLWSIIFFLIEKFSYLSVTLLCCDW